MTKTPTTRTNTPTSNNFTDPLPDWVLSHVGETLPSGVRVLSGRAIARRRFLLNTSDGAVLVEKSRFGEPSVHTAALPGLPVTINCDVCQNHMLIRHSHEGQSVYCSRCSTSYRLEPHALHGIHAGSGDPMPPARNGTSPYRRGEYTLYSRQVELKTGGTQTIYFFAKKTPKSGIPSPMPEGYEVGVNQTTGLPYLQKPGHRARTYRPQCLAITPEKKQCRNSAREGSDYCASHKGYHPPTRAAARKAEDTPPRARKAEDTRPRGRRQPHPPVSYQPQCLATTGTGKQCRNSARTGSEYCASHRAYHPGRSAGTDTKPRVKNAKDTKPRRVQAAP